MRPAARGGYGLDALWNDDFHHSAVVALTGHAEAYYSDYRGSAQEFLSCAKWGFLYQGQYYTWQKKTRGTAALDCRRRSSSRSREPRSGGELRARHAPAPADQPGPLPRDDRLLLLLPGTPLLFQGQEFGSTKPFLFFADHAGQLGKDVRKGRAKFLAQFPSMADDAAQALLCDPADPDVFTRSTLDHSERDRPENATDRRASSRSAEAAPRHAGISRAGAARPRRRRAERRGRRKWRRRGAGAAVFRRGRRSARADESGPRPGAEPRVRSADRRAGRHGLDDRVVQRRSEIRRRRHAAARRVDRGLASGSCLANR